MEQRNEKYPNFTKITAPCWFSRSAPAVVGNVDCPDTIAE